MIYNFANQSMRDYKNEVIIIANILIKNILIKNIIIKKHNKKRKGYE